MPRRRRTRIPLELSEIGKNANLASLMELLLERLVELKTITDDERQKIFEIALSDLEAQATRDASDTEIWAAAKAVVLRLKHQSKAAATRH
jgi:hypothetical protein